MQYNVGWSMIGVTALNIVVNMGIMGYASFKVLKQSSVKLIHKIKVLCKKRKDAYEEHSQKGSKIEENTLSKIIKKEEEIKQENSSFPDKYN